MSIETLPEAPSENVSLAAFAALSRGAPAPYWLHRGVCAAWGLEPERVDMPLITVSENATFRLDLDAVPVGVVRVSQPGYVGGPEAIASEMAWLGALHDLDEVRLISPDARAGATVSLAWHAVPGASRYEVELLDSAGTTVQRTVTRDTVAMVADSVRMVGGAEHRWWVRAVLPDGRELRSGVESFRVR